MSKTRKILAALAAVATVTTLTVSAIPTSADWLNKTIVDEDGFAFKIHEPDAYELETSAIQDFLDNHRYLDAWLCDLDDAHTQHGVAYIFEKDKKEIDAFIKSKGYNDVIVRKATPDEKYDWICGFQLSGFRVDNKCFSYFNETVTKDGQKGLEIVCYAAHPGVQEKFESYISEHGYDKIVPISYRTVGSADDITDLKEITPILKNYVEENNIPAEVILVEDEYDENRTWIHVGINLHDTVTEKLLRDFMEESKLDQANVKFKIVRKALGKVLGDVNNDGGVNVRDCAYIAKSLAKGNGDSLPDSADYNKDSNKNIRDAAAISKDLAQV